MLRTFAHRIVDRLRAIIDPRPQMTYYIDVFGYCNLRCPSCPVGNWTDDPAVFHHGLMTEELLGDILDKATRECRVKSVGLFNWTEPLLHPKIHDMISVVRSRGLKCGLSSNLNILRRPDLLMKANPDWFRVSVSGFTQALYVRGHKAGDIEKVKVNMRRLAEAKRETGAITDLELYFHRYVDNESEEAPMKAYAESLGYRFTAGWATMMPLEKVLTIADPASPRATLTSEDQSILDRLAIKVDQAIAVTSKRKVTSCSLQDDYVVLDVNGNATLCCACMGSDSNTIGNYLTMPIDAIQSARRSHPLCKPCMSFGIPSLNEGGPELEDIGRRERARYRTPEESRL
jgi:pyruvate-formate lyase-activating enzyme